MAIMQGPPQTQQEQEIFPKDQDQAERFLLNTIKVIHEDQKIPQALNDSLGREAPTSTVIGAMAAQVLGLLFKQVHKQTGGLSVAPEFAIEVIRRAVTEIAEIAKAQGTQVSKEDMMGAAKIAGDTLQETMEQVYSGAPEEQPAPQGQPQGVMQGPQQGGM